MKLLNVRGLFVHEHPKKGTRSFVTLTIQKYRKRQRERYRKRSKYCKRSEVGYAKRSEVENLTKLIVTPSNPLLTSLPPLFNPHPHHYYTTYNCSPQSTTIVVVPTHYHPLIPTHYQFHCFANTLFQCTSTFSLVCLTIWEVH
jgi:hypothetical protein